MKPTVVVKLIKAGQTAKRLLKYISGKATSMSADLGFGIIPLQKNQIALATEIMEPRPKTRASECRHVVLSLPRDVQGKKAEALLRLIWMDWIKAYAPDRSWVFAIQNHNGVLHGHGAVSNIGTDGRPLKFRPHEVVKMSEVEFSEHAVSARGVGKPGLPVYTKHSKKLTVEELAELLALPSGAINEPVWAMLEEKGIVANIRRKKNGDGISFECDSRRIRFRTLHRYMTTPRSESDDSDSMINTINTTKPLQPSIVASLTKAGFSSQDLESLHKNLQSTVAPETATPTQDQSEPTQPLPRR